MAPPLAGLKVLDLGSGPAAGLATMELADFGARVVRYEDPDFAWLNDIPSARMWLRGKVSGTDLAGDLADADVLVISRPNGFPQVSYEQAAAVNPEIVYCEITAAGPDSPLPPYEPVIAAKAGRMQGMAGIIQDAGPHFSAVQVATHATAQNTVSAVLAALYRRRHGGGGGLVRTSLLQGLMPYDQGLSLVLQVRPDREAPDMSRVLPRLDYHPVQCADGRWIQFGNLLPHLFRNFMRVAGLEDLLGEAEDNREMVRDRILETVQSRPRDEWMALFVQDGGIAAHPYLEAAETLADPDMTANGHVVELDGVTQLGPVATLTATPAEITRAAKPEAGFDWRPEAGSGRSDRLPLEGVTVLELATIIASPLAASFLADLGARVIKVEAIGGDPFRHMGSGINATRCNQGKESISLDLKSPEGQEIVRALAERADILIHNYRPGVPERLGIGYQALAELNPRLVYVSANGYGPNGPGAMRPSTHPIPGAAMGGAGYQAGGLPTEVLPLDRHREAARRIMRANEVNPDPNTAVVICAASLLGLLAREFTGLGQQIFLDMFGANAYANFDALIDYPGKPERPSLGAELRGPGPLCRLYPAASGWVLLDIRTPREWEQFAALTGCAAEAGPFLAGGDAAAGKDTASALEAALTDLFAGRSAEGWEALLTPAGIGCVRADAMDMGGYFASQAFEGSPWMARVSHAELGDYYRHRPMLDFGVVHPALAGGVRTGVDGPALLAELGYGPEVVEGLFVAGVLYSADRESAASEAPG